MFACDFHVVVSMQHSSHFRLRCAPFAAMISRPKAILLHFKRYIVTQRDNGEMVFRKNKAKIPLKDSLSISSFFSSEEEKHYHLCGVVHHVGNTAFSGHYTTCAKRKLEEESVEEQWVFFNDTVGQRRTINYVTGNETNQENCYMALYELSVLRSYRKEEVPVFAPSVAPSIPPTAVPQVSDVPSIAPTAAPPATTSPTLPAPPSQPSTSSTARVEVESMHISQPSPLGTPENEVLNELPSAATDDERPIPKNSNITMQPTYFSAWLSPALVTIPENQQVLKVRLATIPENNEQPIRNSNITTPTFYGFLHGGLHGDPVLLMAPDSNSIVDSTASNRTSSLATIPEGEELRNTEVELPLATTSIRPQSNNLNEAAWIGNRHFQYLS